MTPPHPPRLTARAILLDPDDRVLMLRIHDHTVTNGEGALPRPDFWILVGGGLQPGEDFPTALRREIHEEVGLDNVTLGPEVWRREKIASWAGAANAVHERFYAARTDAAIHLNNNTTEETDLIREARWWNAADIAASDELFLPPQLLAVIATAAKAI